MATIHETNRQSRISILGCVQKTRKLAALSRIQVSAQLFTVSYINTHLITSIRIIIYYQLYTDCRLGFIACNSRTRITYSGVAHQEPNPIRAYSYGSISVWMWYILLPLFFQFDHSKNGQKFLYMLFSWREKQERCLLRKANLSC